MISSRGMIKGICALLTIVISSMVLFSLGGSHVYAANMNGKGYDAAPLSCGPWQIIPSQTTDNGPALLAVSADAPADAWAVGYIYKDDAIEQVSAAASEHWDGSSWQIVSVPSLGNGSSYLYGVAAVSPDDIWAVGTYSNGLQDLALIDHWDGTQWNFVSSPSFQFSVEPRGITAISANNIWTVGTVYTDPSNTQSNTLVEHWDGSNWSVVASPNTNSQGNYLYGVATISSSDIWAVGYSFELGGPHGPFAPLTEHWNGSNWSIVPSPNPGLNSSLASVAASSSNDVWTVGNYLSSKLVDRTVIEHWDGSKWSVVKSVTRDDSFLNGVVALAANDAWTVGEYFNHQTKAFTLIEHWDGSKWSVVKSPNVKHPGFDHSNMLNGVAVVPGSSRIWTVGIDNGTYNNQNFFNHALVESNCS